MFWNKYIPLFRGVVVYSWWVLGRGLLIAIEGIDGAGKTTQARVLASWLRRNGVKARYTSEPTSGEIGALIRKHLGRRRYSEEVVALLFAADRLEHVRTVIEPSLSKGITVVADRYLHSSIAYQTASTGRREWVRAVNSLAPAPDLSILIDLPVEEALRRIKRRRYLYEHREFLERVREEYLNLAKEGHLIVVDGMGRKEKVSTKIINVVRRFLEEKQD